MAHGWQSKEIRTGVVSWQMRGGAICQQDAGFDTIMRGVTPGGEYLAYVHPLDAEAVRARLEAMGPGQVQGISHRLPTPDGIPRDVVLYVRAGEDGVARGFVADMSNLEAMRDLGRTLMGVMPCGIISCRIKRPGQGANAGLALVDANDRFFELVGVAREGFDADRLMEPDGLLPGEEWQKLLHAGIAAARRPGEMLYAECRVSHDGFTRDVLCSMIGMVQPDGEAHLLCTIQDMTPIKRAQEALRQQTERFYLIASATREYVLDYDVLADTLLLTRVDSGRYEELLVEHMRADVGTRGTLHPDDVDAFAAYIEGLCAGPHKASLDFRTAFESDHMAWKRVQMTSVADKDGRVYRLVGRIMDIDEQKARELEMRARAERDALTALYNRGTAQMLIDDYLAHENALHSEDTHALLMIDLDDFKLVNDRLSHAYGDTVLSDTAQILRDTFRSEDIVARIGGDEFAVLAKGVESQEALERMMKRLCGAVSRRLRTASGDIDLSVSVGIALYPQHGDSFATLFHAADMANYRAKAEGKNRYSVYTGEGGSAYRSQRMDATTPDTPQGRREGLERKILSLLNREETGPEVYGQALQTLAGHFGLHRAILLQYQDDGRLHPTGVHWSTELNIPGADRAALAMTDAMALCDSKGCLVAHGPEGLPPALSGLLTEDGIHGLVLYLYREMGRVYGAICFAYCGEGALPLDEHQVDELVRLSRVLAMVALQGTPVGQSTSMVSMTALLESLPTATCIIDRETYNLLFVNRAFARRWQPLGVKVPCYALVFDRDTPCERCPMRQLDPGLPGDRAQMEMLLPDGKTWLRVSASWADKQGEGGRKACLLNAIDITEYRR